MSCEVINPTAALPELGRHIACTYTTLYSSHPPVACVVNVVRLSFPMMTITSSMMMMMSCFVDPVGAEVANESNSGL